jgi:hypothetical protein
VIWLAFACGMVHAVFSLYWATGGTWLLATVGRWAVALVEASPASAAVILGLVGAGKAAAAIIPVLVAHGRMPRPRLWRAVSWAGGLVLVVYGAVNVAVSGAVLAGVLPSGGGHDADAMIGHAFLWDPLFLLWGAVLLAWLWSSRPGRRRTGPTR